MKSDVEVVSRPESLFMSEMRNFLVFKTCVHGMYCIYFFVVETELRHSLLLFSWDQNMMTRI